jgi:hypothetical protein
VVELRTVSVFLLAFFMCLTAGCEVQEADGPLCLEDCSLCAEGKCPDDRCGLLVILSKDCEGKVEAAEVAVDQCLEEQELLPSNGIITCATVKENQERSVTVRSDEWVWREDVTCTNEHKGGLITLALYCTAHE